MYVSINVSLIIHLIFILFKTPSGVYCKDRKLGPRPPRMPEVFSLRATVIEPMPLSFDKFGVVENTHVSFNRKQSH